MSGVYTKVRVPCPLAGVDSETTKCVQLGIEAIE